MSAPTLERKTLQDALTKKVGEIKAFSTHAIKVEDGGGIVVSPDDAAKYRSTVAEAKEIRGLLASLDDAAELEGWLKAPAAAGTAAADAAAAHAGMQAKSLSDHFLGSDAFAEMKASQWRRLGDAHSIEGVSISDFPREVKDIYTARGGTTTINGFGTAQQTPLIERIRRTWRVRDLFPKGSTSANMLYGLRQTGFTNNARIVPQRTAADGSAATGGPSDVFGLKPKSDLAFATITYGVATIAHIIDVHKSVLDDEPRLRAIIDREMVDGVKMAEDQALLFGDGLGENIQGLTVVPGRQSYTQQAGDPRSAAIRRSMTLVQVAEMESTGVVLNPFDWEGLELERDEEGRYVLALSVAMGAEKRVWRVPVIATNAMPEGRWLTGAFGDGAKIWDREQVNIALSTETRDLFDRNAVALRGEERLALEIPRPEAFVYGTFLDA